MRLFKNKPAIDFDHKARTLNESMGVNENFAERIKEAIFEVFKKLPSNKSAAVEDILKEMKPQTPAEYFFAGWASSAGFQLIENKTELLKKAMGGIGCGKCATCKSMRKTPKILH